MGAKHSKPRIRRSRRFSSPRKRQAPEGSNDPAPTPGELWDHAHNKKDLIDATHGEEDNCKFCRTPEKHRDLLHGTCSPKTYSDVTKLEQRRMHEKYEEKSFFEDFLAQGQLKVDLPRSPNLCRRCVAVEKSKSLPPMTGTIEETNKLTDKEQEWTITLYEIDKMSGRVPREDMARLMSSICDAVDAKVVEAPQGRKTVRVRLSVTPERRRSHSKLHRSSSTPYGEQADCPKTEPTCRKTSDDPRLRRNRSDASPLRTPTSINPNPARRTQTVGLQREYLGENADRRKHYAKLEGLDNSQRLHKKDIDIDGIKNNDRTKSGLDNSQRILVHHNKDVDFEGIKNGDRTKPVHHNKHRTWPKIDDHQKAATPKRRQRSQGNDLRTAMIRTRRKDPRFASPYDQHFQEAMYLRLRELQRQGAFEMRRATGRLQDSDEADDDSSSDFEVEKNKATEQDETPTVDIENGAISRNCNSTQGTPTEETLQHSNPNASSKVNSVHHHHHYHHGVSSGCVATAVNSPGAVKCITNSANYTCSSVVPVADYSSADRHHYHHHYHHVNQS